MSDLFPEFQPRGFAERIDAAVNLIDQYGGIDGDHHKQWVLDQVLRTLLHPDDYDAWVKARYDGDYEWDAGIPP